MYLIGKEHGITINRQCESLCAADARSTQHGCDGASRRWWCKTRARQQRHEVIDDVLVVGGNSLIRVNDDFAEGLPPQRWQLTTGTNRHDGQAARGVQCHHMSDDAFYLSSFECELGLTKLSRNKYHTMEYNEAPGLKTLHRGSTQLPAQLHRQCHGRATQAQDFAGMLTVQDQQPGINRGVLRTLLHHGCRN